MSDAVCAVLGCVMSLLLAWLMWSDIEFQQAAERGELGKHYAKRNRS